MKKNNELSTELVQAGFTPIEETSVVTVQPSQFMGVFDEDEKLIMDLTERKVSYCSLKAVTKEDKIALYNAQNNPEKRIKDEVNMEIAIKDIYVESVKMIDEMTGEATYCPRIVLIDEKNEGHTCVSFGVYSAIRRIIQIFGEPTYVEPIKVRVRQISKGQNKNPLTLDIVG